MLTLNVYQVQKWILILPLKNSIQDMIKRHIPKEVEKEKKH